MVTTRHSAALWIFGTLILMSSAQVPSKQGTMSPSERPSIERPEGASYKVIVNLDGGAFRGIVTTYVLIEFEDAIKRHILLHRPELLTEGTQIDTINDFEISLADFIDCFTGTSSGAWFALYLASKGGKGISANIFNEKRLVEKYGVINPGSARGMLILFIEFTDAVFSQDQVNAFNNNINPGPTDPGVLTPIITKSESQSVFNGFLGRVTLSELSTSCMITGFDLISRSQILFVHDKFTTPAKTGFTRLIRRSTPRTRNMTFMSDIKGKYGVDYFIADLAIASAAAPSFTPAYELLPAKGEAEAMMIVDGIAYRGDASPLAFTQIVNSTGAASYADIAILSITGGIPLFDLLDNANGGTVQWDSGLERFSTSLYAALESSNKQFELFLYSDPAVKAGQYLRIELYGQPGTELSRTLNDGLLSTSLPELIPIGQKLAETYRPSIESFVENFVLG